MRDQQARAKAGLLLPLFIHPANVRGFWVPGFSPGIIKMSIGALTPFDYDLIAMIESILHQKVESFLEEGYIRLEAPIWGSSVNEITALEGAVKGRTGERFIDFEVDKSDMDVSIKMRYDTNSDQWPQQIKYDLVDPVVEHGKHFTRKPKEVHAVCFTRLDIGNTVMFTGGGTVTIPVKADAPATYEFPTENGVLMSAKEGQYIVLDNEHFIVMDARDFKIMFEETN